MAIWGAKPMGAARPPMMPSTTRELTQSAAPMLVSQEPTAG